MTDLLVWIGGRAAFHIGASGVVYAMIGFLLFIGIFRRDSQSAAIALVFLFLYGAILQGVFPNAVQDNVSWESHLLGIIVGGISAYYYRNDGLDELQNDHENEGFSNFSGDADYKYIYKSED